jgi:tRNA threonylcarbamoyladenosine biosynthesis protein TsaB
MIKSFYEVRLMYVVLGIDTALNQCGITLLKGKECFIDCQKMQRGHAEILIPKIVALLKKADISFADIDLIAVTIGPGSFTGLRVGLASAKGISLASKIPLVGFKTFEVLANTVFLEKQDNRNLLVAIDSLRADIYCQLYTSQLAEIKPAATIFPEAILNYTGFEDLRVIGNSIQALQYLKQHHPQVVFEDIEISRVPQVLCQMAIKLLPITYQNINIKTCQLFYLRPPDVTLPK